MTDTPSRMIILDIDGLRRDVFQRALAMVTAASAAMGWE